MYTNAILAEGDIGGKNHMRVLSSDSPPCPLAAKGSVSQQLFTPSPYYMDLLFLAANVMRISEYLHIALGYNTKNFCHNPTGFI